MTQLNFVVIRPKFTRFFSSNVGEIVVDNAIFTCPYLDSFQTYSQSKFKVVQSSIEFWTFFALPYFSSAVPANVVSKLSCLPRGTSRGKGS